MQAFERGSVVRVPFPYTDRSTRQRRPALVVSDGAISNGLLWVVMITSAENRARAGDHDFGPDFRAAGLPAPSIVRTTKIATIEAGDAERLGQVSGEMMGQVATTLLRLLGL